ncbi:MAG: UTP--glucose-1-phosphate uridylyltransferase, partial [Planctomycetota bacterium]|nr:UTP--glucose-1-phosphate uridylyltransferase [Planctomycetota bacterium]
MTDAFDLADHLATHGQSHLLEGVDALDAAARAAYLERLAGVDWNELAHPAEPVSIQDVGPSRVVTLAERAERRAEFVAAGDKAYQEGAVALLMVAGGQGTRLGFNGPKGCYEIGAHSGKSIYQVQAEKVLALCKRVGREVPFLVMTSPATDVETRAFFAAHDRFGLSESQLRFFSQGTVPSIAMDGRALMAGPGKLLENPDGHGGCFQALLSSGELRRLRDEGVRQIVYIQVDNILAPFDDAELVGLAEIENSDVITKVLEKAHPDEKVGHLVRMDDHDVIIEYTEVTPEQTRTKGPDGELVYRWGSPAMHCWGINFLAGLEDRNFKLPLHRSVKPLKAWCQGETGEVKGHKNERFIFDLVPMAGVSLGMQIEREYEFAPVKNAEGADSAASTRAIASAAWTEWLRASGVTVELAEGN